MIVYILATFSVKEREEKGRDSHRLTEDQKAEIKRAEIKRAENYLHP